MFTDEEIEAARLRGEQFRRENPWVVEARYDRARRRVVVVLSSGLEVAFDPLRHQGLENARHEQLAEVELLGDYGLHWEALDADIWVPSLLKGITGSKAFMARQSAERAAA